MNTKVVSSAEPILHLSSKRVPSPKNPVHESISFTSHVAISRFSIRNPITWPRRARSTACIGAVYAPAETSRETLYELLGIGESGSTLSDIKKAYKNMARKYHPDVSPPDRVDEYTQRFIMMHQAYETLSDPQSRALYDRDLAAGFGSFSSRRKIHQKMEENGEWKTKWQSQLDELKRREMNRDSDGGMSWGARMRSRR
ncbi:hypothetical protein ACP275_04G229500 [Erythranthe tilingii]